MMNGRIKTAEVVTVGAASAQSAAIGANIYAVLLTATVTCHVRIGPNPTATTDDTILVPGWPYCFVTAPGEQVAVIQESSGGKLSVTQVTNI